MFQYRFANICTILTYIKFNIMCTYFPVWAHLSDYSPCSIIYSCPLDLKFTSGSNFGYRILTCKCIFSTDAMVLCYSLCRILLNLCLAVIKRFHPFWQRCSFLKTDWILILNSDLTPLIYSVDSLRSIHHWIHLFLFNNFVGRGRKRS